MVYCTKCGTKNEEGAKYCSKCGVDLEGSLEERFERRAEEWGGCFGRRAEKECFGLPHGGSIVGIIIGIIIIIVALSWIPGLISPEVREATDLLFGPLIVIIFGILIIAGVIYGTTRKR